MAINASMLGDTGNEDGKLSRVSDGNLRSHFLGIHGPATSKRAVYLPDE
jgi:hypothetical protein